MSVGENFSSWSAICLLMKYITLTLETELRKICNPYAPEHPLAAFYWAIVHCNLQLVLSPSLLAESLCPSVFYPQGTDYWAAFAGRALRSCPCISTIVPIQGRNTETCIKLLRVQGLGVCSETSLKWTSCKTSHNFSVIWEDALLLIYQRGACSPDFAEFYICIAGGSPVEDFDRHLFR